IAKLKKNMLQLDGEPQVIAGLPEKGLKEGPLMFERKGTYYLIYPHVAHKTERLEYAISDHAMGPFKVTGVIMDATPDCWTNQASVIQYKGQWYLFYHHNYLSPHFDKNRSVAIDSLFFNPDGTIRKVKPTLRGVGLTAATAKIQVDRYSAESATGTSVAFLDSSDALKGWKTILDGANAWVRYNAVAFGNDPLKSVCVRARSETGGVLQLRLDTPDGLIIARVRVPASNTWSSINAPLSAFRKGRHNLIVQLAGDKKVEIDWVRFK
ncbi:MAG: family 43 glycosylhydrolase, partial [Candidatus Saccharimonadales bacterium]